MDYPAGSLGGYLPTFYINWIFKKKKKRTHKHIHFSQLPRGFLGWLPTYILYYIDFQKPSKAADTQAQAFMWITQRAPWVATYLYFILTGFSKTAKNRGHTSKGILVNYPGAPWVATYLHFILTEFSKTAKSSGHTSTGILVNYPEVFLSGYRKKSLTHNHR